MNRENLEKLATYLESLPKNYEHFNMGTFFGPYLHPGESRTFFPEQCGTVACAVGHGPAAGVKPNLGESWHVYSLRSFFDIDISSSFEERQFANTVWDVLFSAGWDCYDNTHTGAAKRIRWALSTYEIDEQLLHMRSLRISNALRNDEVEYISKFLKEYR